MPDSSLGDLIFSASVGHSIDLNYTVQKWSDSDVNSLLRHIKYITKI